MPDTSAAASDWSGIGFALTGLVAGIVAWLGRAHAGKDQAKSPTAPLPEVAGVTMALIDAKVQAGIARDTERTADGVERLERLFVDWVETQDDLREKQEKDRLEDDVRGLKQMLQKLLDEGAQHRPGRPLRDPA